MYPVEILAWELAILTEVLFMVHSLSYLTKCFVISVVEGTLLNSDDDDDDDDDVCCA
jgi:hypothetical protein